MKVIIYAINVGLINIPTGMTGHKWSIYEKNTRTLCLADGGFLLIDGHEHPMQIGDEFTIRDNDSLRKLKTGTIMDTCKSIKEDVFTMLERHNYNYRPIKAFRARPKFNRKLLTSYAVKGVERDE